MAGPNARPLRCSTRVAAGYRPAITRIVEIRNRIVASLVRTRASNGLVSTPWWWAAGRLQRPGRGFAARQTTARESVRRTTSLRQASASSAKAASPHAHLVGIIDCLPVLTRWEECMLAAGMPPDKILLLRIGRGRLCPDERRLLRLVDHCGSCRQCVRVG